MRTLFRIPLVLTACLFSVGCATCNEATMTPAEFNRCQLEKYCGFYYENGSELYYTCLREEEITVSDKALHYFKSFLKSLVDYPYYDWE
jgi:hypothetical protein